MEKPLNRERGWKLDPKNDRQIRWWTGKYWTDRCEPAGEDAELYAAAELGEDVELPDRAEPPRAPRSTPAPKAQSTSRKPDDRSPGWKPDPANPGQLRYWKGGYWTQMYAVQNPEDPTGEPVPIQASSSGSSGLVEVGYLTAVLLPVIGLVIAIILLTKDEDDHGLRVLLTSVVCGIGWLVLFSLA